MKKVLIAACLSLGLFAQETYYELGNFEKYYVSEIGNEQQAKRDIQKAKTSDPGFEKAYRLFNIEIKRTKDNKPNMPDFVQILNDLKLSNTRYGNWLGLMTFIIREPNLASKKSYVKEFGLYFSDKAIQYNMCSGYAQKSRYYEMLGDKQSAFKAAKIGYAHINSCIGNDFSKRVIKINYVRYKYLIGK